jgi:imidazolonepropionase-like amidohydrolase
MHLRSSRPIGQKCPPFACIAIVWFAATMARASDRTSVPLEGLRDERSSVIHISAKSIVTSPGQMVDSGAILVRDGHIEAVGANLPVPPGARTYNYPQGIIYPGFIESYSEAEVASPRAESAYWNRGVTPETNPLAGYTPDQGANANFREAGFVARLIVPSKGHIRGTSTLIDTSDKALTTSVVRDQVAMHANLSLRFSFQRNDQYPGSPMGALTLVRQALLDAEWYRDAWRIARANPAGEQPEMNTSLAALVAANDASLPWIFDATSNERYFMRSDQVAREFGLPAIILGSGREYRRLTEVLGTKRAIILPLRFPKAPYVDTAEAARRVPLEHLLHWDLAPNNPGLLVNGGANVALSTYGLSKPSDFWPALRKAIRRGLSSQAALASLTTIPAELLGADQSVGTIAPGQLASFVIADGDLFSADAKAPAQIIATWVQGNAYAASDFQETDPRGMWSLEIVNKSADRWTFPFTLEGRLPALKGKIDFAGKSVGVANLEWNNMFMSFQFPGDSLSQDGICRLTLRLLPGEASAVLHGTGVFPSGEEFSCRATKLGETGDTPSEETSTPPAPPANASPSDELVDKNGDKEEKDKSSESDQIPAAPLYTTVYPLSSYGLEAQPGQPTLVLFKDATVWTSGPAGRLERGSVLVEQGRIKEVGVSITPPADALVIDCQGKHISPGIIDCHSHIATDGGVNEAAQAITAEVRIGDFIDSDDIAIYRQLAGGVTSSNILHGSANPIGGQNQVIKMRWGSHPEGIKFSEAPQGIKFALGENVKQSNWGDNYRTRYPQTRMGVDELIEDAFLRAKDYANRFEDWKTNHKGLPPRRDLELEALSEVLAGTRWIHCHSYRQSEIMALMLLCDRYNIKIGTFQHILEGYKVADEMAKRGIMGSAFSDWWAYKYEVYDAIPYAGALMHNAGVVVSFNSDDAEMGRRLNLEAAKAMRYGEVPAEDALKFVTLNPARQLRIESHVGSLEPGKHADLVVWSGNPLSVYSRCEQTWVDGRRYFSIDQARELEQRDRTRHAALVQRVLTQKAEQLSEGEADPSLVDLWPRSDTYCHDHEHHHDDGQLEHDHGESMR